MEASKDRKMLVPILLLYRDHSGVPIVCGKEVFFGLNEPNGYQQLLNFIRSFPETANLNKEDYSLSYLDLDNDQIPVQSEAEFTEYLKVCKLAKSKGKVRALQVCEKGKEYKMSVELNKLWSEDGINENKGTMPQIPEPPKNHPSTSISNSDLECKVWSKLPCQPSKSDKVPKWFSEEMQKFKTEMIQSMKTEVFSEFSAVMRSFAQEVQTAVEKSKNVADEKKLEIEHMKIEIELLKADMEMKKSKKSKEKKKSEKKEKAKALGNNSSASKPAKEKPAKLNSANGAFNLAGMKSFDGCSSKPEKSSSFRDHILPCQKRICLNEEKKNKLFAVAKRKKDCPQKARKVSEQVKWDVAEVDNQLRFSVDNMKKDAECHRFKMNDPSFSPPSSDSDQREGLEESDDIVVVGFNSSFDEISDSDLSLEGLVPGVTNEECAVDVDVPTCFFPEVPMAFKGNTLPLRLKRNDVEALKSKTSSDRVSPPSKKCRSKAKKCDKNAFMVDEKGICHTVEQWKELEKEWQVIGKSFDNSAEVLNQIVDDFEQSEGSSCSVHLPKSNSSSKITENVKIIPENGETKVLQDHRNDSTGTKKTVSEMLLSREPPHSDIIKERKRKKDPNLDRLMDIMLRLCKTPVKKNLYQKNESDAKPEDETNLASNPTDQDSASQLKHKAFPNDLEKGEDRYLLKSLHSSDESSTSDYEECEEINKVNGKSNMDNAGDPVSAFHPVNNKSKTDVAVANKAIEASVEEDPIDKVISFLTITDKEDPFQGVEATTSNQMTACDALDSTKQGYTTSKAVADDLLNTAQQSCSTHKMASDNLLHTLKQNCATSSTRASQTNNAGSSNEPPKFSFTPQSYFSQFPSQKTAKSVTDASRITTDALRAAAGANLDSFNSFVKNLNSAPHDSAGTSSYFNTSKNPMYPPQQIPQQPGAPLSTSSSYNPFTTGPSFFSDLYPNGYPYVPTPYMPLPKNFSCSQSFQSSQSAQNLIPKPPTIPPPPPPPIVIPPHMPQDKHFYFHQPAYNTLYTNSVNPYYTNPQFNAFLNKGDPLKNCPALKRDPTYTTPVMGHIYPSVYPIYYPPSTVPLNNSQNNLTTVLPPVATPPTNFTQAPLQTTGQPSNNGDNSQLQNSASKNEKSTPNATVSKTYAEATLGKNEPSSSNFVSRSDETAALDVASGVNEASAPAAPCGIEVSSPGRSPKPSARLNIADFISERFLSTLNSAATNVKEVFTPSRFYDDKKNGADALFRTDDIFPEFMNAFLHKEPIYVHILHQSTCQRYFVMPHKNVAQSHTFHCDLRSHMKYEKRRAACTFEAGLIYALHENLHLSKEDKDTWSRVKLLSIEGTLIRAQKIDFGVIVHCDSHNLTQLPDKFKSMPALVAEVVFSDPAEPNIMQKSPLHVKPLQYFNDGNYWLVKICENPQDSDFVAVPATNSVSNSESSNQSNILNYHSTVEGEEPSFEDASLDNGGEAIAYEQLEQSLDDKIKFLQDIGFRGEEDLRNLLILNNEDLSDVIDILTSSAVGNYYFSPKQ